MGGGAWMPASDLFLLRRQVLQRQRSILNYFDLHGHLLHGHRLGLLRHVAESGFVAGDVSVDRD